MPASLGTAYVQILPSMDGISSNITQELGGEVDKAGEKAGSGFGSKFAGAAGTLVKAGGAAVIAAGAGITALTTQAVDAYANYEQLVGGVETLFSSLDGSSSASATVMANAANAYQTAGISANEYMETVTSFSAALVSAMENDYEGAANVADMALRDMSDNANKMGTDMASIQTAYQGFAKQNYTMLDNLKLGYGGTKSEMERLLADASALSGVDYNIENLDDVYNAIHVIQTEMGITGTTAKEASSTISGSIGSLGAAWQNLLTGMANKDADINGLIQNVMTGVSTVLGNLQPIIIQTLNSIGTVIQTAAPMVIQILSETLPTILPALLDGIQVIIAGLSTVMPQIVQMLIDSLPLLIDAAMQLIAALGTALVENIPLLISTAMTIVENLTNYLIDNVDTIIDGAIELIMGIVTGLLNNLPKLFECAAKLIIGLATGLVQAIPQLIAYLPEVITGIANGLMSFYQNIIEVGANLIRGLGDGLVKGAKAVVQKAKEVAGNVLSSIKGFFGIHSPSRVFRDQIGANIMAGFAEGLTDNEDLVENAMSDVQGIVSGTDFSMNGSYGGSTQSTLLAELINRVDALTALVGDGAVKVYLDGKQLSDSVTKHQRMTARAMA